MRNVRALRGGKLIVADKATVTPAGCFADAALAVPPVADPRYVDTLLDACSRHAVRVLVPLIDLDLDRLAPHVEEFASIGTTVVCPPRDLVDLCLDKRRFAVFAEEENLAHPRTCEADELDAGPFPLFAKRSRGFGSIGAVVCRSAAEARRALAEDPSLVFQELVEAPEVSVDAYVSVNGRCLVRVPRIRDQVVGGEAQQSHTIRSAEASRLADDTITALARRGLRGPMNIQLFLSDPPKLIEVNTRLGSGSVLANEAVGGRFYTALLQEACGEISAGDPDDYRENLWMYRYFGDVFHDGSRALRIVPDKSEDD